MGRMSIEPLNLKSADELLFYLVKNHSAYAKYGEQSYYLTDVNDSYWRAQDINTLNEKGHYVDCSELVPTCSEFVNLPFIDVDGAKKSMVEVFSNIIFYASVKDEA